MKVFNLFIRLEVSNETPYQAIHDFAQKLCDDVEMITSVQIFDPSLSENKVLLGGVPTGKSPTIPSLEIKSSE